MPDINDVKEAISLAVEAAKSVGPYGWGIEELGGVVPMHVSGGISAEALEPSEIDALSAVIGNIIDEWQEKNPSIARNWKKSTPALMFSAMLLKGITGTSFGQEYAEEEPAKLMATEIRPVDVGKTGWSVSVTAGSVLDIIGTATEPYSLSQTAGERKVVCIIKDGFLTIDTPMPIDEIRVEYDSKTYMPYAFGAEGLVPAGQSENKLNYTARLNPILIQPGVQTYVAGMGNATVTTNLYILGMTFYEKNAFSTL